MLPNHAKTQNTNDLVLRAILLLSSLSLVIGSYNTIVNVIVNRPTASTQNPEANAQPLNTSALDESLCSLDFVLCPSDNVPALESPTPNPVSQEPLDDQPRLLSDNKQMTTAHTSPEAQNSTLTNDNKILVPTYLRQVFSSVCQDLAPDIKTCPTTLSAIAYKESRFNRFAKGDFLPSIGYRSHGLFQIQTRLHNITIAQAQDPDFSARWTLKNLLNNGYPKYATRAIARHNGGGVQAKRYASHVKRLARIINN